MNNNIENIRKRLIFRSWHRGTREMDLIMGSFADKHVPDFDESQLAEYEEILQTPDPDLYDWISGRLALPDDKGTPLMELLIEHNYVAARTARNRSA